MLHRVPQVRVVRALHRAVPPRRLRREPAVVPEALELPLHDADGDVREEASHRRRAGSLGGVVAPHGVAGDVEFLPAVAARRDDDAAADAAATTTMVAAKLAVD